ncbi:MAG: type III secretion HpaP family protein, partial [Puniceicoccales bacterium]|nr:type III secretion HpaP family protein [Puniceicoccales bacterium]
LEHFERKLDDKIFPQTQIEEDGVRKKLSPKIENDLAKATAVKIENKNSVSVDAESKMSEKLTGRAIIHGYENIRKEEEIVPAKNFDRESVGKEKKEGNLQLIQLAKEQPVVVEEEEIVPAKNFVREDVGKEKKEGDLQLTQLAKEQPAVVEKEEIVPAKNFDRESVGKEEKEEDLQLTQLAKEQPVVVEKEKVAPARNFDRESVGKEKKEGNLQLTRLAKEQPVVVEKEKIIPTKNFDRESVGKEEKEEDLQLTQLAKEQPVVMEKSEVIEKAPLTIVSGEKVLETLGQISDTKIIAPAETISKIGYEIVERLMIAQSVNAVKQEVIIVFKENVLPGTQVSLVREKSELSLMFTTVNTQSMESLTAGQDGLRSFLFEQLKDITAIHIKFEERGSGDLSEKNPQKRQQNQQSKEENSENTSKK